MSRIYIYIFLGNSTKKNLKTGSSDHPEVLITVKISAWNTETVTRLHGHSVITPSSSSADFSLAIVSLLPFLSSRLSFIFADFFVSLNFLDNRDLLKIFRIFEKKKVRSQDRNYIN